MLAGVLIMETSCQGMTRVCFCISVFASTWLVFVATGAHVRGNETAQLLHQRNVDCAGLSGVSCDLTERLF